MSKALRKHPQSSCNIRNIPTLVVPCPSKMFASFNTASIQRLVGVCAMLGEVFSEQECIRKISDNKSNFFMKRKPYFMIFYDKTLLE